MRTYTQEEKQAVIDRVISSEPSAHNATISFEKQTKSDGSVIIRVGIDDKEKAETIMNTKKVVL